jgi:CheY-like chemotaxis protein
VLQNKPRILILDDFPEKGRVLSKILNSKGYSADSLTYPLNGIDRIEKERPDLLIFDLYFSEAIMLRILQKIRESNPSLPIFIYSDSVTEQFENQATKLEGSVFFPKAVKQILDRIEKLSLSNNERELTTPSVSKDEKEGR